MDNANLTQVIFYSLVGGLFSLIGGFILLNTKLDLKKFSLLSVPFAAGALLAAVFVDILPEGLESNNYNTVLLSVLAGIILFFILERITHWFHHHHEEDVATNSKTSLLIIIGDTIHNALDGVVIASAFLISVPTGIVTTFVVATHEIPQEIGDFGVLLAKGMSRKKVLLVNIFSALATTVAAVLTFQLGSEDKLPLGIMLGLSAGFLLYIALSDLIPTIHSKRSLRGKIDPYIVLLIFGVLVVASAVKISHHFLPH